MRDKFILISGSASRSCPQDKLYSAIELVKVITQEVLARDGGIVVLAGAEESTKDEERVPRIFDWVALREVRRYANETIEGPRKLARVVMSDEAPHSKIEAVNLKLMRNLEQADVLERLHIRSEIFTGGEYRKMMTEVSDAMIAIGGGKGTYAVGILMTQLGKPVLPLNLKVGAITEDGFGALDLHREMMSDPRFFMPNTHSELINRIGLISMEKGINEETAVGRRVVEFLNEELESTGTSKESLTPKWRLTKIWGLLMEIPRIAGAIKILEFLRGLWHSIQQ